jgi:hypothetical protein
MKTWKKAGIFTTIIGNLLVLILFFGDRAGLLPVLNQGGPTVLSVVLIILGAAFMAGFAIVALTFGNSGAAIFAMIIGFLINVVYLFVIGAVVSLLFKDWRKTSRMSLIMGIIGAVLLIVWKVLPQISLVSSFLFLSGIVLLVLGIYYKIKRDS